MYKFEYGDYLKIEINENGFYFQEKLIMDAGKAYCYLLDWLDLTLPCRNYEIPSNLNNIELMVNNTNIVIINHIGFWYNNQQIYDNGLMYNMVSTLLLEK